MQISPKPAAQARNDFEILMHSSKEEQINYTFSFYSVYMLQVQEISRPGLDTRSFVCLFL